MFEELACDKCDCPAEMVLMFFSLTGMNQMILCQHHVTELLSIEKRRVASQWN